MVKRGSPTAASKFLSVGYTGIDTHIPQRSSLWFSAACTAAIGYRNYFICLYQQIKFYSSKAEFLKLPFLLMPIRQKSLSFPRDLIFATYGELLKVFSAKVNLFYFLFLMVSRHPIMQNCFLKSFPRFLVLMNEVSLYLLSHQKIIHSYIIFI